MEPTPATPIQTPPPAVPAVPAVPLPDPVPIAAEPPKYQAGGFFKQFDWVEIGFMALGVAALVYSIYYYRKKAKELPNLVDAQTDQERRLTNIELQFTGSRN